MQSKSFPLANAKATGSADNGVFEASVSVFDNIDLVDDVVRKSAFDRAIKEQEPPPIVWTHMWGIPPIGETLDWSATSTTLDVKGALFVGADDKHQYADMVYAALKSREGRAPALKEWSFSYDVAPGGARIIEVQGKRVQELNELYPIHEVGPTLRGANPETSTIAAPKSLSAAARAAIDSAFGAKAYADISGYSVYMLLSILDYCSDFISYTDQADQVQTMRDVAGQVMPLLVSAFEAPDEEATAKALELIETVCGAKSLSDLALSEVAPSDATRIFDANEVASLLTAMPT